MYLTTYTPSTLLIRFLFLIVLVARRTICLPSYLGTSLKTCTSWSPRPSEVSSAGHKPLLIQWFSTSPMKRYGAFYTAAGTREPLSVEWNRERETPKSTFHALRSQFLRHLSLSYGLCGKNLWYACCDGQLRCRPIHATLPWVKHILMCGIWVAEYVEEGTAIYHLCARAIDLRA